VAIVKPGGFGMWCVAAKPMRRNTIQKAAIEVRFLRMIRKLPIVSFCFLLVLLLSIALPAQIRQHSPKNLPPAAYKLVSIKVTGTKRYKPEDVIRASGLQLGQVVHKEDLENVVRLLGESGAFTDILYNLESDPEGTRLKLTVLNSKKFVPVTFDNVVWFSSQELFNKLHASVPLFDGEVPVTGQMVNQISDALQALLDEKKVAGQVDSLRVPNDGPTEAVRFAVTGLHITIRNIEFSGADAAELPLLVATAKRLQGVEYVLPTLRALANKTFLPVYFARSYLKAEIGDPQAQVVSTEEEHVLVDVTFPVHPGKQYTVSGLEIVGSKALPEDTLRSLIHVKAGETANAIQLEKDLEAVKQLYGTRGYVAADVRLESKPDDSRPTVMYLVRISEGDVYRMGDLKIRGLDSKATARLQNNWTLRPGDVYDSSYAGRFVQQAYKEIGDWDTSVHESVDEKDSTVDVEVRFDSRP
jgi:outer membrane protein assembly factor BamA